MALGGPSDPTPATKAKDRLGRPHSRGAKGRFVKGNGDAAKASARLAADKAWLPDIDARSTVFKRYREIASAIVDDQQGVQLAETMKSLIKRFAAAEVLSEQIDARITNGEQVSISEIQALSSTLVRLSARIGIKRGEPKDVTPTLEQYLAAKRRETAG